MPSALVLLGWPVLHLLVLLGELLLDQAAHALLLALIKASLIDVEVALQETSWVLHLAFLEIALVGVLLLFEEQFSLSGCQFICKSSFVFDCIVLDTSLHQDSIFPFSLENSLKVEIFKSTFAVGFSHIKRPHINSLL